MGNKGNAGAGGIVSLQSSGMQLFCLKVQHGVHCLQGTVYNCFAFVWKSRLEIFQLDRTLPRTFVVE